MRRVVVTGAGAVSALGLSAQATMRAMAEGVNGVSQLAFADVERLSIQIGGQVHNWDPEAHFNRQQIVLYDKFTQFTLLAAREAVAQAGLNFDGHLGYDTGVVLGTAGGGVAGAPCRLTADTPGGRRKPARSSRSGSVSRVRVSAITAIGWWNAPIMFLPKGWLIPVLPPTELSTWLSKVVGT